ncbi:MAG: hypothetical protein WCJ26_13265 [bacterium]
MNRIYKTTIIMFVAMMAAISVAGYGQQTQKDNRFYTLYPPLGFGGTAVECNSYLYWQKPQLPNGTTPAGLLGYYVYRDGIMIFYVNSGEILSYYDYSMEYGTYNYTITANYDLTSYGIPGQFGESSPAGPVTIFLNCDPPLPFYEPWDAGSFTFQNWQFIPAQGNWAMNTSLGNPLPTALFSGSPAVQNYDVTLKSISLPCSPWVCANIYLEFDYKLSDISAGGTEKLIAEYLIDNTWFTAAEFKNEGSTGWIHQKIDISQVCGKRCRLGFNVTGANSANISSWAVDNIRLSAVCKGPSDCSYTKSGNVVSLTWQPPACDSLGNLAGYNVYRTDESGAPPFNKINASPITGLEYHDVYPSTLSGGHFRYVITDIQRDPADNTILCEAPCDTLVVDYISGTGIKGISGLVIRSNYASESLTVQSDSPVESCEMLTCLGQYLFSVKAGNQREFSIPLSGLAGGIYLVKIKNASGSFVKKISVMH